jgi:hypothetical protein
MTEWRSIPISGLEGFEVSSEGFVRNPRTETIMTPSDNGKGYQQVCLFLGRSNKPRTKTVGVHRAVAVAFLGPRPEGSHVNHKDGDKRNNSVENLEYVTPKENVRHAYANGLVTKESKVRGAIKAAATRRRLTEVQVRDLLNRAASGESRKALAAAFGLHENHLSQIVRGAIYATVAPDAPRSDGVWRLAPRKLRGAV